MRMATLTAAVFLLFQSEASAQSRLRRLLVDSGKFDPSGGTTVLPRDRVVGVGRGTRTLLLHDLRSGTTTPIETGERTYEVGPITRDGRTLAYIACRVGTSCDYEVHAVNVDGSNHRTVFAVGGPINWMQPHAWSPDGRRLLGVLSLRDRRRQIVFVTVATGEIEVVKTVDSRDQAVALSPDGQYIAYAHQTDRDRRDADLIVLSATSRAERRVPASSGPKAVVGWAPDGSGVLFTTAQRDTTTLWFAPVRAGATAGPPRPLRRDLAAASDIKVVGQSVLFTRTDTRRVIYELPIDLGAGTATGAPRLIESGSDISGAALLSPDGSRVAFARAPNANVDTTALSIIDLATGAMRSLILPFARIGVDHWFPDGQTLAAVASLGGRESRVRIDLATADGRDAKGGGYAALPAADAAVRSLSGEIEYMVSGGVAGDSSRIVARDVATGRDQTLAPVAGAFGPIRLSPDGRKLAVAIGGPRSSTNGIPGFVVINTDGGSHEVYSSDKSQSVGPASLVWSADSRHLLYRVGAGPSDRPESQLWLATLGAGAARMLISVDRDAFRERSVQVAPDGRRVVYTADPEQRISELWVIENLPGARPASRRP